MRKHYPIEKFLSPIQTFIRQQRSGSVVLVVSVVIALVLANTGVSEYYFSFFNHHLGIFFDGKPFLAHSIKDWINDGLMALFFFVVGLELKREFISGELSNVRKAILPIGAAIGGMIVPALIYLGLNPTGEAHQGWGIPMATDIAFALGILYLLGDRIPLTLKVFLTALAIVDDLGAVLVIAFFYTSEISTISLLVGLGFVVVMYIANKMGVRSLLFYALLGVGGVWGAFLLSGVHATIAAVLAAFTIPADTLIRGDLYAYRIKRYLGRYKRECTDGNADEIGTLEKIKTVTNMTIPPLQRLEHMLHPFVTFVVLPVFALANAGVSFHGLTMGELFDSNVMFGTLLGLLAGKVIGIVGVSYILVKLKIASLYDGMNKQNLLGVSFLGAIGFTMSLFITSLAFSNESYVMQAKIGIFAASIIGGLAGYLILRSKTN